MNRKIIVILFLISLFIVPLAYAQRQSRDITGGLIGDLGETITEVIRVINVEFYIPHPGFGPTEKVTLIQVVVVFVLLFAILWAATSKIKLFQDDSLRGARKGVCIAIALGAIFISPITEWIATMLTSFIRILILMLFIVGIFFIVHITRSGMAGAGKIGAEASKQAATNLKMNADAAKLKGEILGNLASLTKERLARRNIRRHLKNLSSQTRTIEEKLQDIKKMMIEISYMINQGNTDDAREYAKKIAAKIPGLIDSIHKETKLEENLGKIVDWEQKNNAKLVSGFQGIIKDFESFMTQIESQKPRSNKKRAALESLKKEFGNFIKGIKYFKEKQLAIASKIVQVDELEKNNKKNSSTFIALAEELGNDIKNEDIGRGIQVMNRLIEFWNVIKHSIDNYKREHTELGQLLHLDTQQKGELKKSYGNLLKKLHTYGNIKKS